MTPPLFAETRQARSQLVRRAESVLFELVLAEPTGSRTVRTEMLTECRDLVARLRAHLQLASRVVGSN